MQVQPSNLTGALLRFARHAHKKLMRMLPGMLSWTRRSENALDDEAQYETDLSGEDAVDGIDRLATSGATTRDRMRPTDEQSHPSYSLPQSEDLEIPTTNGSDASLITDPPSSLKLAPRTSSANGPGFTASTVKCENSQPFSSSAAPERNAFRDTKDDRTRANMAELAKRLSDKRMDMLAIRVSLQEKRLALRQELEASIEEDARFLQELRTLCTAAYPEELRPIITKLDSLVANLASTRDRIFPKQDDYNKMEDYLIRGEFELKELESNFYTSNSRTKTSVLGESDVILLDDKGLPPATDKSVFDATTYNPKEAKYLSRLGDMDIIQERIANMYDERSQILSDQETRKLVGRHIESDSQLFLDRFPQTIRQLEQDLEMVQQDVSRLRDSVTEDKVLYAAPQFDEDSNLGDQLDALLGAENQSPASEEPLLHPSDESGPRFSDNDIRDPQSDSIDMGKFINCWLLYQLKQSPFAVRLFKTLAELDKLNLDKKTFATLALRLWAEDDMVQTFARHRKYNRSVSVSFRSDETQNVTSTNHRHLHYPNSRNGSLRNSTRPQRRPPMNRATVLTV